MASIFIFHGVYGHSGENWFPWLKTELEKKGHRVFVPDFPHPDHPTLDQWMQYMTRHDDDVDEQTIFVGHSLGAAFALRLIGHMHQSISTCFLVAPVWMKMGNEFDQLMLTFTSPSYDWKKTKEHCGCFSIFQSTNDPYIALEKTNELAKHLSAPVTVVRDAGHFNSSAGYTKFPQLRDAILAVATS